MKKILHPLDVEFNGKFFPVFLKVEDERDYFSISGVVAPLPSGNAKGSAGQIDMDFKDGQYIGGKQRYAKGWNESKWKKLLDVWSKYHLKAKDSVPKSVLVFINGLPSTDKTPAWV
jgi:hypothetical protein